MLDDFLTLFADYPHFPLSFPHKIATYPHFNEFGSYAGDVISSDVRSEKSLIRCLASSLFRDFSSQAPRLAKNARVNK